jgi:hypothetical protein
MHPHLTGLMAEAHRQDLLREADQHRLAVQARAARPRRALLPWKDAVVDLGQKVRLFAKPSPVAAVGCAPQPSCCPA